MIGEKILHYEILSKLGEGGMGVVYKAHDTKLERTVAIKFLPGRIASNADERSRFETEAKAAAALNHANIATIYSIEEHSGEIFIVMEYIEGQELKSLIEKNPQGLPDSAVVAYAAQIASGLQAAHKKNIVHRDIKSTNIMITEEGQVKIMDFGLAKVRGSAQVTKAGTTLGTAAYMSPEQAKGDEVDHRADIWSFGTVFFEMVTGQLPFGGDYEQAVTYSILNEDPKSAKDLRPDVPEIFENIISKTLNKDPDQRYQEAVEILTDLERTPGVKTGLVATQTSSAMRPVVSGGKNSSLKYLAFGIPVLAVLIIAVWFVLRPGESDKAADPLVDSRIAVMPFSVRGNEDIAYLKEGMVDLLSTKLDGVGELVTVDPNALLGYLTNQAESYADPGQASAVANHFRAGQFILGSIIAVGDRIQIGASLYGSADGAIKTKAEAVAETESEVLAAIDDLTKQLVAGQFAQPGGELKSLAISTTESMTAIKAYLRGSNLLRAGQWDNAIEALQVAVAADSNFAMAWHGLTRAFGWAVRPQLAQSAAKKALALSDNLPTRIQWLLRADVAFGEGRHREAERLLRNILANHPDELLALLELGDLLFHYNNYRGRPIAESKDYFRRALLYDPNNGEAVFHLIEMAEEEGRLRDQDSLITRYQHLGSARTKLQWQFLRAASRSDGEIPPSLYEEVSKINLLTRLQLVPRVVMIGNISAADRLAQDLLDPSVNLFGREWAQHYLVGSATTRGKLLQADKEARTLGEGSYAYGLLQRIVNSTLPYVPADHDALQGLKTEVSRWDTLTHPMLRGGRPRMIGNLGALKSYLNGLINFRLRDEEVLNENIMALSRKQGYWPNQFQLTLEALRAWQTGDHRKALETLEAIPFEINWLSAYAFSFMSQVSIRYMRGEVNRVLGNEEEALRWYHSLHEGSSAIQNMLYMAPSFVREAEIHQKRGDHAKALKYFDRFIDLWSEADPELQPVVAEARQERDAVLLALGQEPQERAQQLKEK